MTQQADWIAEREAIRARLEVYTPASVVFASDTERLLVADLRRLLTKSEEDEREKVELEARLWEALVAIEEENRRARHAETELALREQRIEQLNGRYEHWFKEAISARGEVERLRKANEEVWEQAAKIADKYALANKAHAIIPMEIATRLREAARQSREDENHHG